MYFGRLAARAAEASGEVKALIEKSAGEVSAGSRLVADASGKLVSMLGAVEENSSLIDGIAKASREQASAIDEVSAAVRTMDEMTQHNAALVEETNAAIEQTEAQAQELDDLVDVFRTGEGEPAESGARALQERVRAGMQKAPARTAVGQDWEAF